MLQKLILIIIGIVIGLVFRTTILEWLDNAYSYINKNRLNPMNKVDSLNRNGVRKNLTCSIYTKRDQNFGKSDDLINTKKPSGFIPHRKNYRVVKKGETLIKISSKYSINPKDVARWNCIPYNSILRENDTLRLYDDNSISINKKILTHVVKPGETLNKISLQYGTPVSVLKKLNGLRFDKIFANQVLIVDPYEFIKVRSGTTLSHISRRYNVSISRLAELNKIENPDILTPGNIIKIETNR